MLPQSLQLIKIKRALISTSDKSLLDTIAQELVRSNVEIISTGGTGRFLKEGNIPFTPIEAVTGNKEAFDGRMKTISFQLASSLLFRRDSEEDQKEAAQLGIGPIDLVLCNLYPFEETVQKKDSSLTDLVENIDIGGPTMIRAAAKNFAAVTVCVSPGQYQTIIDCLQKYDGHIDIETRKRLALESFQHTANYDSIISCELEKRWQFEMPTIHLSSKNAQKLRYGENPHQQAWAYPHPYEKGLLASKILQGKPLSHNNLLDSDAALRCADDLLRSQSKQFEYAVSIIKHLNPCGASLASSQLLALQTAWSGDPISSFGSIIAFSHQVDSDCAGWLSDKFVEVILAPSFTTSALEIFSKKKNLRLLVVDYSKPTTGLSYMVKSIYGGWLVQTEDSGPDIEFQTVTDRSFADEQSHLIGFGTMVSKHLKSNAIALVKRVDNALALVGAGMGNPNRLISLKQALEKAQENGHSAFDQMVLVSDAFFPFSDNIELANSFGIKYIIQPGGSIKDTEVIKTCNNYNIAMIFTGKRHFRH